MSTAREMWHVRGRHDSSCPGVLTTLCCNICRNVPYYTKSNLCFHCFLFLPRSDQMLEDIIFKLVPGLQESEPVFLIVCVFLEFKQVELTHCLSLQLLVFHLQSTCMANATCGLQQTLSFQDVFLINYSCSHCCY